MTIILEVEFENKQDTSMMFFLSEGDTFWLYGQKVIIKSIKKKEE